MLVEVKTGYYDNGVFIDSHSKIFFNYLKTIMVFDLVSLGTILYFFSYE